MACRRQGQGCAFCNALCSGLVVKLEVQVIEVLQGTVLAVGASGRSLCSGMVVCGPSWPSGTRESLWAGSVLCSRCYEIGCAIPPRLPLNQRPAAALHPDTWLRMSVRKCCMKSLAAAPTCGWTLLGLAAHLCPAASRPGTGGCWRGFCRHCRHRIGRDALPGGWCMQR